MAYGSRRMPFRLTGVDFALTFPRNETCPKVALERIRSKEKNLQYAAVAREHHQDGGYHLHVHLQYSKIKDTRKPEYFDYIGGKHGDYEVTRDSKDWQGYIRKEGNEIFEHGTVQFGEQSLYEMAKTMQHDHFFEACRKKRICFQYAKEAWLAAAMVDTTIEPNEEIPGSVTSILSITDPRAEFKSTVIVGPSGIGKTVHAKRMATKPALFVSHLDDLKSFDPRRHRSIIFDDMSFTHIPIQGQIHLVDQYEPRSIHVRYGVVKIPRGIEKWFTSNSAVFTEHPAVKRRINQINLY